MTNPEEGFGNTSILGLGTIFKELGIDAQYEKIHVIDTYDAQTADTEIDVDVRTKWTLKFDEYIGGHGLMRMSVFKVSVPVHPIAVDDVLTLHWTIL